jgi:PAS domain S-box-containing protein
MARRRMGATGSPADERSLHYLFVHRVRDYAIYLLDPQGMVTSWNAGAERFKGYTSEEVIGQHFSRFYTEEDRAAGLPEQALALAERDGVFEAQGWRVRKDGTRFWANVVIDPIRDDDGRLVGFAKITRDITEQRKAQESLDEARARLHQAQKMEAIGQLTGGFVHDFNNILQVVGNNVELAARGLANGRIDAARHLETARDAVQRATQLTGRLLAFARKQPLAPERIDVRRLVEGMRPLLEQSLGAKVTLEVRIPDDLWTIWIDSNQLESALLNLAINARDAMPDGGCLTISASNLVIEESRDPDVLAGEHVCIVVADTGTGMAPEVVNRAFEPFFTTKAKGQGTGLGLAQIYGFVRQSRGGICIESEPGRGTTIVFCLPREPGAAPD